MSSNLGNLQITSEDIRNLVDLNFAKLVAIDFCRGFIFKKPKHMLSVLLTEIFILGLSLILFLPPILIFMKNSGNLPEDQAGTTGLFSLLVGLFVSGIVIGNVYLYKQGKRIKSLVRLMDQVDNYNGVIKAIELAERIEAIEGSSTELKQSESRKKVIDSLAITKQSLVNALQVENLIRSHDNLIDSRQVLLSNLDDNFATLMAFELSEETGEYGRLLNQSLQIGMSVHKEVINLQGKR
ncbi:MULTISPECIES: hypothetical protein [Moorena]|uniref:Uncharacterized protein n=1 Tax=Moorena producens 3L TaxID=489825 RepID=F4XSJ6_9CYAN|nr:MULTISPECIES: hypothetical protein [Moorena]EGJ32409.1 hypothetical protein LYNGBM3L_18530 [Moorena producens 3L]NEP37031.1 hypothetical protein [Moorena sp. SIO3B2]NEP69845.1 hypothetical protein [Moorena sp. SIO3A5]NER85821.1 hypothetical protein [Moorena sp. SIO3A2]NES41452.1 hypothetical protein [Moorena sp. SIO2C4]